MLMADPNHYETDWLGSSPLFLDEVTRTVSHDPGSLTRLSVGREFDPEGLEVFFEFGYSAFGLTPISGVKILPHSTSVCVTDDQSLKIDTLPDPFIQLSDFRLAEDDVLELIRSKVQQWENSIPSDHEIVLPLSGGFDSRLLLWSLSDRSRVRAFSYGVSWNQRESSEVTIAEEVARRLGVRWNFIPLGNFNRRISDWNQLYGVSTHAHGMYHLEFYSKIKEIVTGPSALLSGILGDLWAGAIKVPRIDSPSDMSVLAHSHGMRADPSQLIRHSQGEAREKFFNSHRLLFEDSRYRVLQLGRTKMLLLSYLLRVPRTFGFATWSPFLDQEIVMAMLNLPQHRRDSRLWQADFFESEGLLPKISGRERTRRNNLNLYGLRTSPVPQLDPVRLRKVVSPGYTKWINDNIAFSNRDYLRRIAMDFGPTRRFLKEYKLTGSLLQSYYAYLVLQPLHEFLGEE